MMGAVDADFAAAVDFFEPRIRLDQNQMTVRHPGGVAVRHGARLVLRQVQKQRTAEGDVELLHSEPDAENRHPAFDDMADEQPVAVVAAFGHQMNGGMRRQTVAARVEVEAAAEQNAVETVEKGVGINVLAHRRQHDGQAAGRDDGVDVTDGEAKMGGDGFGGRGKIGVDADERPRRIGHGFSLPGKTNRRGDGSAVPQRARSISTRCERPQDRMARRPVFLRAPVSYTSLMTILRITNGRVIDPSQGLDQVTDLWIRGDRILGVGPQPNATPTAPSTPRA